VRRIGARFERNEQGSRIIVAGSEAEEVVRYSDLSCNSGDLNIARVAVSSIPFSVDKPYDYIIPKALCESALPGVRVLVPFGKGNRHTEGIIFSLINIYYNGRSLGYGKRC
jgi:hypothetical protein